jgi:hypothetical protein
MIALLIILGKITFGIISIVFSLLSFLVLIGIVFLVGIVIYAEGKG